MTETPTNLDRRTICGGGGSTSGTTTPPPPPPPTGIIPATETKAGMLAQPTGTVSSYISTASGQCPSQTGARQGAYLIRDAAGIYAISASCLHQGGRLDPAGAGFSCPCHGSQYDLGGQVTQGPAPVGSFLPHYEVRESTPGGTLVIDTTSTVASSVRLT